MIKKIVYVVNADWYFQLHWLDRAKAAKNAGMDVLVVAPLGQSEARRAIEREGIRVVPWPVSRSGRNPLKEFYATIKLAKILKSEAPDLVHSITVKPNIYVLFLRLILRFKVVVSVTGLGMLFTSPKFLDRATSVIVRTIYAMASRSSYIFFENNDDLQVIKNVNIAKQSNLMRVMGAGVSANDYTFSTPKALEGELILFFAARLLKPKGLDILYDSVSELNHQGYKVKLAVAGISDPDSPVSISQDQIVSWSQDPFFEFLGKRDDIPDLIKESHFVCLPTTYGEGIPRILIEAAAMGRPIITSNVAGCREICEHRFNGFLVEPGSSQGIVDSVKEIFENPELLSDMSRNSRSVFERGYDSEKVINFTLAAYDKIE